MGSIDPSGNPPADQHYCDDSSWVVKTVLSRVDALARTRACIQRENVSGDFDYS
jgi:hypothetical protein